MQMISKISSTTAGPATRIIQLSRQLSMREKNNVTTIAPIVKKICTNTEYFCRFASPTTSPKKKKQILIAASHPHPLKNKPTATMYIFTLQATIMVPIVQIPHDTTMEDFLPKLSEKKEMTIQPMNAPKYVELLTRSIIADLLQRQLSYVAREVKSLSYGSIKFIHQCSGNQQTQSLQSLSDSSNPQALQLKDLFLKRKAVLRRMMPVTNQQITKISTINN